MEAIFEDVIMTEASNADQKLVENLLSQFVNCKQIINKKAHNVLDSFCLITELQSEFWTAIDERSQTKNKKDIHKENLN